MILICLIFALLLYSNEIDSPALQFIKIDNN